MIQEVKERDKIYAILYSENEITRDKTVWIGPTHEPLQGSCMYYSPKTFRNHRHILNPRTIKRTQEAMIVLRGSISIEIYSNRKDFLDCLTAKSGDAIFLYDGYHKLIINDENTKVYEVKCGQFTSVEDDKEFFND